MRIGRSNVHHHQPHEQASLNSQPHGPVPRENRGRNTCQPPGVRTPREHVAFSLMDATRTGQHVRHHLPLRFCNDIICWSIALHSPIYLAITLGRYYTFDNEEAARTYLAGILPIPLLAISATAGLFTMYHYKKARPITSRQAADSRTSPQQKDTHE